MGEGTRVVDYGKDIADLRAVVVALQMQVAQLQKRLEEGAVYGGAVAYSAPKRSYGEFDWSNPDKPFP